MKKGIKKLARVLSTLSGMGNPQTTPLISISISESALLHNLAEFRKRAPGGVVAPVLKSNAYGHGLDLIASILEKKGGAIPFFVIDSYFEAKALRSEGIRTPLLIIGYSSTETILKHNLKQVAFTLTSLDGLRELSASSTKNPVHIHLKIDTGMGRQGILPEEIDTAITILTHSKHIVLQGICSHFPDADNTDPSFTQVQIKKWNGIVKKFRVLSAEQIPLFPSLKYWHLSNTDGHEYSKEIDANVSRLGIGLYLHPTPVLEMKTVITSIKKIKKGDKVGYSGTFIAPHDMTIATIPVGYFEGVDRRLSNTGFVKVIKNGDTATYFAPIIGRVSMNITTIDVSGILDVKQSDSVVAISANPKDTNSVEAIALTCETISYEILVHIPAHLKRVVKQVHFQ